jgi:hypothetical protein
VSTDPAPTWAEAGIMAVNEIKPASPATESARFAVECLFIAVSYLNTLLR